MEVILVTDKPKYRALVNATKTIQSPNVDIVAIIDTEVFLNHHYDICFYCFRNNFPFQMHMPIKAAKQLLDRNEGPIDLKINKGKNIQISSENDLMEIFPNIQQGMQDPIFDSTTNTSKTSFLFQFWDIQIQFIIINDMEPQEIKLRDAMNSAAFNRYLESQQKSRINITNDFEFRAENLQRQLSMGQEKVNKAVIFINDDNYEQFLSWSQGENGSFSCEANTKLSKEYRELKQEVDNQKNSFRNKIKMVETLLGENINVEKLLTEEKDQNAEFKRLKETFETIKNIDKVIIDQQKRIESLKCALKEKKALKHEILYSKAREYTQASKNLKTLEKEIQQMAERLKYTQENRMQFLVKRSFEPTLQLTQTLENYVTEIKTHSKLKMNNIFQKAKENNLQTKENPQQSHRKMAKSTHFKINKRVEGNVLKTDYSGFSQLQKEKLKKESILSGSALGYSNKLILNNNMMNVSTNTIMAPQNASSNQDGHNGYSKKERENSNDLLKGGILDSTTEGMKNMRLKFRQLMLQRSASSLHLQKKQDEQKQTQVERQNEQVKNEIESVQLLLLNLADYYKRNHELIKQIKTRNQNKNDSTEEISNHNRSIIQLIALQGNKFYLLKELLEGVVPNNISDKNIGSIVFSKRGVQPLTPYITKSVYAQTDKKQNKLMPDGYDRVIEDKDKEKNAKNPSQPTLIKNHSSDSLGPVVSSKENVDNLLFPKASSPNESDFQIQTQIIAKAKNTKGATQKNVRKCSLMKEEFNQKRSMINFR